MAPQTLSSAHSTILTPRPFSQSSFRPYGTAITTPNPSALNHAPADISSLPSQPATPVIANQGSAVKYSPIAPMQNSYGSGKSVLSGSPRMSMFSCFPRKLRAGSKADSSSSKLFDVRILERHPYTSQTFIPLSYSNNAGEGDGEEPVYLVIVAPTLSGQTADATVEYSDGSGQRKSAVVYDPPDLNNLQAFLARPGQAVTYAAGTWHAPMVVLGQRRVDFLVVQFVNGIDEEDCQEVSFGEGLAVDVNVSASVPSQGRDRAKL